VDYSKLAYRITDKAKTQFD